MTYDQGNPNGNASPAAERAAVYFVMGRRIHLIAVEQSQYAQLCTTLRNLWPPHPTEF